MRIWSGRWESNPRPLFWKLLNILPFPFGFWNILEHNRRDFIDSFPPSVTKNVRVHAQSDAGVGMTQLLLHDLGTCAAVEQQACVRVSAGVETATWDGQQIQDRPQPVLHDLVAAGWPSVSRNEQKAVRIRFPLLPAAAERGGQATGAGH